MQRNMDLVRQILIAIRDSTGGDATAALAALPCSSEELQYHLHLLYQACFTDAHVVGAVGTGPEYLPTGLTWAGCEFLDDILNETVWSRTKQVILDHGGSLSLSVAQQIAQAVAKSLRRPL